MSAEQECPQGKHFVHKERLQGHYRLGGVRLAYGDSPPVVDVQALNIRTGERVALSGGNGTGKSTLLRLLSGLLDTQAGRLLLDDASLAQIDPADRQRGIDYLSQDVTLFHGSLRDSLNPENAVLGDEEPLETPDRAGLDAFVRGHPLGLNMSTQGNASLSGGQRQAVELARVLLQDPPTLLLDEPTAAFDQGSEKQAIDYLQQWLSKRILVITAHKKSMFVLVERAVVLRQDRVIMDGLLEQVVQGNQVQAPQAAEGGNHGL